MQAISRSASRTFKAFKPLLASRNIPFVAIKRSFGDHAHAAPAVESGKGAADSSDVVIPELFDTLEWVLDSPPSVHQFDEPPIVVEIEHLKNLIIPDDD